MVVTTEMVAGALGVIITIGALVWKAATKLGSIESKVDKALDWINEQKVTRVALPVFRKRKSR